MTRATWVLGATTLIGVVASAWLYVENRGLRDQITERQEPGGVTSAAGDNTPTAAKDLWLAPAARSTAIPSRGPSTKPPALPDEPKESRLERRARRTEEMAAMLGRHDGETDDEYRARMVPLITAGLAIPRSRAEENRRTAEEKAHVTPEQSAKLDKAVDKTYADVLEYTNKAIADGTLSPSERNVAGWLEFAGGMGGILNDAQSQVGKILDPSQIKTMYDSGFEWGEYLGLKAPWEKLQPPPPRGK